MKALLIMGFIATSSLSQAKVEVPKNIAVRMCELVSLEVSRGFDKNLKSYSVKECLKNAEMSIFNRSLISNPREMGTSLTDSNIAALEGTDLWLTCEFELNGKVDPRNLTLSDCSIEQ